MTATIETLKGLARHVMHCLSRGHREAIYHSALVTALNHHKVLHRSEVPCPIWFMGQCIGMGRADLVIDDMIVEIKANRLPPSETSAQLQKYLQSLSKAEQRTFRGVVINFNQKTGMVDVLEECMLQRRPKLVPCVSEMLPEEHTPKRPAASIRSRFFTPDAPDARELPLGKRRRVEKECFCCTVTP